MWWGRIRGLGQSRRTLLPLTACAPCPRYKTAVRQPGPGKSKPPFTAHSCRPPWSLLCSGRTAALHLYPQLLFSFFYRLLHVLTGKEKRSTYVVTNKRTIAQHRENKTITKTQHYDMCFFFFPLCMRVFAPFLLLLLFSFFFLFFSSLQQLIQGLKVLPEDHFIRR